MHLAIEPKLNIFNVYLQDYIQYIFPMLLNIPRNTPLKNDIYLEYEKTHIMYMMEPYEDVCRLFHKSGLWRHYVYESISKARFPELFKHT